MTKVRSQAERFNAKVSPGANGCTVWTGGRFGNGYGMFYPGPRSEVKKLLAHRWSYEHFVGPIPDGFVIDHLCKNILCTDISSTEKTSSCTLTADGEPAENVDDNEIASAAPERPHDGH